MTQEIETKDDGEQIVIDKAWYELWLFASNQIAWGESSIDFDGFKQFGQEIFDVKIKEKY